MFSGIIETIEKVKEFSETPNGKRLVIERNISWIVAVGNSIAIQGVCLTVVQVTDTTLAFDLVPETLERTVFGKRNLDYVNIERARSLNEAMDGSITTGHIDTLGKIKKIVKDETGYTLLVSFEKKYAPMVIEKGSIVVDGVSLTIVEVGDDWLSVVLIPFTREHTTLGTLKEGDSVNLEFDMIGKYINRYMEIRYAGNK